MGLKRTFEDAFNLLCGDKLGSGVHRTVYECRIRPDLVVKVESDDQRYFANVVEQKFWDEAPEHVRAWLAPCEYLSPDGRIMLQFRCEPLAHNYSLPDRLPRFLDDHKRDNFGLLNGKLVCMDYARHNVTRNMRLVKARW